VGRTAIGLRSNSTPVTVAGQGHRVPRLEPVIGAVLERPEAVAQLCKLPKEGCEGYSHHPSRVLRGVHSRLHRSRQRQDAIRLRDAWFVVHSFARGIMESEHRQRILRWPANGPRVSTYVRLGASTQIPTSIHSAVGVRTQLACMGSAAGRKERIQGAGMVSLAEHSTNVRVNLTTTTKGAIC